MIDDLGAGYSNLKLIADLEPDVVKIDRSLVTFVDEDRRRQIIARGIVRMCEQLGAQVVAEGIERPEELAAVRTSGRAICWVVRASPSRGPDGAALTQ